MYNSHFDRASKRHNRIMRVIYSGIAIIFILILLSWGAIGFGAYKVIESADFSHGLKGVVEQVWYGNSHE